MPRKANPVQVGRMACVGCGSRIPVFINARGYFYTKCAECGTDQRNGKAVQTHIYANTDWMDTPPEPPRCVDPADLVPAEPGGDPVPEPESEPAEPTPAPVPKPVPNQKKPGFSGVSFLAGFALPLIIIGVLP